MPCAAILKSGVNKGKECGKPTLSNKYCKRHENAEKTCAALIKSGPNKGKNCHNYVKGGNKYCGRHKREDEEKEQCCICFEDLKRPKKLKCGHEFHENCIEKWFETKSTCPLCRDEQNPLMNDFAQFMMAVLIAFERLVE